MGSRLPSSEKPDNVRHLQIGDTVYYQLSPAEILNVYKRGRQWMLTLKIQTDMGPRTKEVSTHAHNLDIPRSASMR
jgi:hypothetical protein